MPALCQQHYGQRPEYYPEIEQRRHVVDVEEIKYDHVVKVDRASARDPSFQFAAMLPLQAPSRAG